MNTIFTYLRKKIQVEVRVRNKIGVGVKKSSSSRNKPRVVGGKQLSFSYIIGLTTFWKRREFLGGFLLTFSLYNR